MTWYNVHIGIERSPDENFGLGFPELAIISAVFAIPLVAGVLLIVALILGIRALLKYLRSTD
ncbi:MAG: hypothetical protein ACLTQI_00980 [Slackia sp.]